jgi:hypothetical protein
MAINTVSKFSGPNTDFTGSILRRIFGYPLPEGVLHVDLENDITTDLKKVRWITKTGTHSMTLDLENLQDQMIALQVTMRMTC